MTIDRMRPEAVADTVLSDCRPQQEAVREAHLRWVDSSAMSERAPRDRPEPARRARPVIRAIRDGRRRSERRR